MRQVSLNARTAHDAASTAEVEVVLFTFEHATLSAPVRLSTDPTERLSTEPLAYGTRSAWLDADPATEPYLFVLASAALPDDIEDSPAAAEIVLDNVDVGIAEALRSITNRATAHMAIVLASTPDVIEAEFRDLRLIAADGDADRVSLHLSRLPIEEESVPMDRFTKQRFPGLFR